ncbi:Flocculation suppression protein [Microbotryomycetes sp. JL221]|nr:Flocculation suppression protein [Microbotryomycetes sp. JL221]
MRSAGSAVGEQQRAVSPTSSRDRNATESNEQDGTPQPGEDRTVDDDDHHRLDSGAATGDTSSGTLLTESGPAGKTQQAQFTHKLFAMVQNPALKHMIAWSETGSSFYVFNPTEFARQVLPQFFKHNNFQSFVRQCNMYGFSKVNDMLAGTAAGLDGVNVWEFQHPSFQKDRPDLLNRIRRKSSKATPGAGSAGTAESPGKRPSLASSSSSSRNNSTHKDKSASIPEAEEGDAGSDKQSSHASSHAPAEQSVSASIANGADGADGNSSGSIPRVKGETDPHGRDSPSNSIPSTSNGAFANAISAQSQQNPIHPLISPTYPPSYARRQSFTEELNSRQVTALEGQVRWLSDQLYYTQQEQIATKAAAASLFQGILGLVESLDPNRERKDEIARLGSILQRLAGDQGQTAPPPSSASAGQFNFSPFGPSPHWHGAPLPPATAYARSLRPISSSSQHFAYSRPGPAESFARGAPAPSLRRESRDEPASPYTGPYQHLPTSISSESTTTSAYSSMRSDSIRAPVLGRPPSSNASYSTSRMSWPGPSSAGTGITAPLSKPASPTTSLPPISALFGEADGIRRGVDSPAPSPAPHPTHTGQNTTTQDPGNEQAASARKKARLDQ